MCESILIITSFLFYLLGYFVSKIGNDTKCTLKICKYLDEQMENYDFSDDAFGSYEKLGYLTAKRDVSYFSDRKGAIK